MIICDLVSNDVLKHKVVVRAARVCCAGAQVVLAATEVAHRGSKTVTPERVTCSTSGSYWRRCDAVRPRSPPAHGSVPAVTPLTPQSLYHIISHQVISYQKLVFRISSSRTNWIHSIFCLFFYFERLPQY